MGCRFGWKKVEPLYSRSNHMTVDASVVLVLVTLLSAGCGVRLQPGRDAYYQTVTQVVPAQSSGSHSQRVSLTTSSAGEVGSTFPTTGVPFVVRYSEER